MKPFHFLWVFLFLLVSGCTMPIDVFEKNIPVPNQQWEAGFKPEIIFSVTDTVSLYNIYLVIRHTDAYNYNNIWVSASLEQPGEKAPRSQQYDLLLATNEKGWLGSAMDDIYEQRVLVQPQTKFKKTGDYHFTITQLMREDPLKHVLNIGLRVEKVK